MKNLLYYYMQILLPIPLIALFAAMDLTWIFLTFFIFYVLIYRPIIDGDKLVRKGLMNRSNRWKLLLPFWHIKYFKELYLSK